MLELTTEQALCLAPLFTYTEDTLIKSFLQGHMGRGWADQYPYPTCGCLTVADFWYFAGDHTCGAAVEMIDLVGAGHIVIPENEEWGKLLLERRPGTTAFPRYAFTKDPAVFDRDRLVRLVAALPEGFRLRQIDGALYDKCLATPFAYDFVGNFASKEDFEKRGLGFCVMKDEEIAGGASSYTIYTDGIEIEIGVAREYRRKGLATAVGAKLILAALDRGLYPSWDAANMASVGLAKKLGYRYAYEYTAYETPEKGETE